MNAICYVGLGANLGNPQQQLEFAVQALRQNRSIELCACSSLYASKPMGPQDQPDFVNAVAKITTALSPLALLETLQGIENDAGRVREQRWGPRTLDLDILLYAEQQITSERLQIPHPGLTQREFVLLPLTEIAPDLHLPDGRKVATLAQQVELNGLQVIAPAP